MVNSLLQSVVVCSYLFLSLAQIVSILLSLFESVLVLFFGKSF